MSRRISSRSTDGWASTTDSKSKVDEDGDLGINNRPNDPSQHRGFTNPPRVGDQHIGPLPQQTQYLQNQLITPHYKLGVERSTDLRLKRKLYVTHHVQLYVTIHVHVKVARTGDRPIS